MTVLLAAVAAIVGFISARFHLGRAIRSAYRATRLYHVGIMAVWLVVAIAYVWVAAIGAGVASLVGSLAIRPALIMLGALHLGLEGQYRRGEW